MARRFQRNWKVITALILFVFALIVKTTLLAQSFISKCVFRTGICAPSTQEQPFIAEDDSPDVTLIRKMGSDTLSINVHETVSVSDDQELNLQTG